MRINKLLCSLLVGSVLCSCTMTAGAVSASTETPKTQSTMSGDINGDGKINVFDTVTLKKYLMGTMSEEMKDTITLANADLNNDGEISSADLKLVKNKLFNTKKVELETVNSEINYFGCFSYIENHKNETLLIETYDDLDKYLFEVNEGVDIYYVEDSIELIKTKYNQEFFESNSVAFYAGDGISNNGKFESATIENNCLSLNYFADICFDDYPNSTGYLAVTFTKEELSKHEFTSIKFNDTAINVSDKILSDIYITDKDAYGIDTWINNKIELASFVSEYNLDVDMTKYDDDYFLNNKLVAYGAFSSDYFNTPADIITLCNDKYISINIQIGSVEEGSIYFFSIPNSIYKNQRVTISQESGMIAEKPVIYLYPEKETRVDVSININGGFVCVYPEFTDENTNTWSVTAEPDGTLYKDDGSEYSYLFWEGMVDVNWDLSKGFIVKGTDTAEFLNEKLAYMGLSPRECNDFIVYWLPEMQKNKYNYVTFQNEVYTDNAILQVSPQPDSLLRVFMTYTALDFEQAEIAKSTTQEPELSTFVRNGFTVVEWGGAELK